MERTRSSGGVASTASEVAVTTTQLRELIANGENSHVEFKSDVIENRQLAKELVAFANLQGGCVLLGIDDDGSVRGLTRIDSPANEESDDRRVHTYQRLEEWVMQACRDKVRPEIIPYFEIFRDVEPGPRCGGRPGGTRMERAPCLAQPAAYLLHSSGQCESRGERGGVGAPVSAARRLPSGAPTRVGHVYRGS